MSASPPQVVLVTGASSGIGEAAVRALLAQGYRVHAGARRVGRMQALREAGAVVHALDVTDETSISAVVSSILENEGRLDVLVNNAGYGVYGAIEEVSIEEARDQFEVNLFGIARLTQLILPSMRTAGSGTIINISSMGGRVFPMRAELFSSEQLRPHSTSLAVQPLSSVEALEQKGRRKRLVVFDLNGTLCEPNEPVDEDPAIFLLSKTRSKRNDPPT